ncbi:hypothetical protein EO087_02960 [Dyella sp. M7H15-1]|uniref:hypothetical protein n=1 Tax=Dyella sp. M7H15-1 TaxID=2501295 RepID=UPI001004D8D3|nr:hypothetical protein [Dyella sp. M7H15-1]QAU23075.1 hypothetical protein EO087_02960 [Dyella sp. M7H15-1]
MTMTNISMKNGASKLKIWVAINAIGLILYLYFSSRIWAPADEAGLMGGPGDPILWAMTALPFLIVCSLINILWFVMILLRKKRSSFLKSFFVWVLVVAAWILANRYDEYRQYRGTVVMQHAALISGSEQRSVNQTM